MSSCMYICAHKHPQTNAYLHIHMFMYIYTHKYTHTEKERVGRKEEERDALGLPQLPFLITVTVVFVSPAK